MLRDAISAEPELFGFAPCVISLIARITEEEKWLDVARDIGERFLSLPTMPPYPVTSALIGLGLTAAQNGNEEVAAEQYALLEPQRGRYHAAVVIDRVLGLLAQTMGNLDDAAGHFEDALAFCRKAGYRPELAWSLCDYADMLQERKGEGDSEKAVAMLDESLAISTELGMRPLMERVLGRREILKA